MELQRVGYRCIGGRHLVEHWHWEFHVSVSKRAARAVQVEECEVERV